MHASSSSSLRELSSWPSRHRRAVAMLTAVLAALTLWELLYPFNFDFQRQVVTRWLAELDIHKLNTAGNVLLFMPWTAAAGWLLRLRGRGRVSTVVVVTLSGAAMSMLAETVQVWLPLRTSSLVDLLTNTLGSAVGAGLGFSLAGRLSRQLDALLDDWTRWPATRGLAWALLAMLVVRTAPFDLAPETRELQVAWDRTVDAGMPFSATIHALRDPASSVVPVLASGDLAPRSAATELVSAALAALVFVVVGYAMARAIRQRFEAKGDRTSPALFAVLFSAALVVLTEIMKWPIHSRVMNATDVAAGLIGVFLGVTLEGITSLAGRRSRRPRG